ncbi:MAG TPA: hypothetical protein VFM18_07240 [Methanosarcina sp.]|nr:hypothetical protein [Methanosarcina sp.]
MKTFPTKIMKNSQMAFCIRECTASELGKTEKELDEIAFQKVIESFQENAQVVELAYTSV